MKFIGFKSKMLLFLEMKSFIAVSLFVFIAKLGYSIQEGFSEVYFEDWRIANNIVKYGVYSEFMEVGPTAYKLPVYPLFLSIFIALFPEHSNEAVGIAQHLLFFIVPFLIIKILSIFNREKAGIIAGYMFMLSPAYFYYSNVFEVTNVFIPIFLCWLYFYLKLFKNGCNVLEYIGLILFTALLFLTQVVVVPFAVLLLLALPLLKKITIRQSVVLLMLTGILYSPWMIRNAITFEKFIPTKTPFWQNIYLSLTSEAAICQDVMLISDEHQKYTFKLRKTTDEFTMEKIYKQEVLRVSKGNEEKFVKKAIQNAYLLWYVPSRYIDDQSLSTILGRKVYVMVLNIMVLFALTYYFRKNRWLFWGYVFLFCGFTVPYMVGHAVNTRFKLDFEWTQFILIALFLSDIRHKMLHKYTKGSILTPQQ